MFDVEDQFVGARQAGDVIWFPRPLPLIKHAHVSCGYKEWLKRKYSLPGFVEVEPGDTVVDCGAYVGGFTLAAAGVAERVHAFEPDQSNFAALSRNTQALSNVVANQLGLYNRAGTSPFNLSGSSVEHSLLKPDDGAVVAVVEIPLTTIAAYLSETGMERLDFFKIEAEGVEIEIFEGLEGVRPRKLAIDVSPERDGASPAEAFKARLAPMGYDVRQRGHVLFARLA